MAALRAFSHPNIVKFLDTALVGDAPAMVLELAGKGELSKYLWQPLNVRLALSLAHQVADALRVIHESGRVHGDVKPANIFVNDGGTLKLGDFGLGNAAGCTVIFSCVAGGLRIRSARSCPRVSVDVGVRHLFTGGDAVRDADGSSAREYMRGGRLPRRDLP